jgi:hypothetical protein
MLASACTLVVGFTVGVATMPVVSSVVGLGL